MEQQTEKKIAEGKRRRAKSRKKPAPKLGTVDHQKQNSGFNHPFFIAPGHLPVNHSN